MSKDMSISIVRAKTSRSAVSYAKATGVMKRQNVTHHARTQLANYLWTGHKTFQGCPQLSVTYDASYVAGKDLLAIALHDHTQDTCMWLPPQALLKHDFRGVFGSNFVFFSVRRQKLQCRKVYRKRPFKCTLLHANAGKCTKRGLFLHCSFFSCIAVFFPALQFFLSL